MTGPFNLNPSLDATSLAEQFRAKGRVRITPFLQQGCAERLRGQLQSRGDWKQVINSGERVVELDRPTRASLDPAQARQLDDAVYAGARTGFQYRYESIRVPDEAAARKASGDDLARFASFLSTGKARDLLRTVLGESALEFADAQATAYAPGDFLTGHDDRIPGKHRLAAYVLSLNPTWRIEWGGLLLMHRADGSVEGEAPAFNSLDLFRVGQMHSVSEVTRAAAWRRYAITGWLRTR